MSWPKTGLRELIGLFIDDGSLAVAVVVWIAAAVLIFPALPIDQGGLAVILFAGIAAILVENVVRAARRRPPA